MIMKFFIKIYIHTNAHSKEENTNRHTIHFGRCRSVDRLIMLILRVKIRLVT